METKPVQKRYMESSILLHINASRYKLRICLIYVYSLIVSLVLTNCFVCYRERWRY